MTTRPNMSEKLERWGRNNNPSTLLSICVACMFLTVPIGTYLFQQFIHGEVVYLDPYVFSILLGWIVFQIVLYTLPDTIHHYISSYSGGLQYGGVTPAGNKLEYTINGLQAWIITHILFGILCYYGMVDGAWIAKNWMQLFISANIIGYCVTFGLYYKALYYSSHPEDNIYSGSVVYDIVMGVELNPRWRNYDIKLFWNGRVGIIAWTLINISFMIRQFQETGVVYNSMILVNILQGIYVLDFFWNESWYLRTIDMSHDAMGWNLSYGSLVFLPFMYTLQSAFLSTNYVTLSSIEFNMILILGLIGYIIFRCANSQKDKFRLGKLPDAVYIDCSYITTDGKTHHTKLLVDYMWSVGRHMNYTGDLMLSLAFCLSTGRSHILPYFYIIYMIILLMIRCVRDENKCAKKYGKDWEAYCNLVKYKIIPYIY